MPFNTSFITIPLEGLIWKMLPDETGKYLLIEYRNDTRRKVDFLCVDMKTKKILWQKTSLKELWWLGLKETTEGKIIIHGYKNSKSPEHKGIYVIDLFSGKLLWENKDLTHVSSHPGYILAANDDPDKPALFKMDIQSGELIQTTEPGSEKNFSVPDYKLPVLYTAESNHFMTIATFISQQLQMLSDLAIEYLEHHSYIIISFYTSEQNAVDNYIAVFDVEGNLLLQEKIGTGLKGIGQDTFFIYGSNLVYVKNKSELVIREI